jgi:uncharacterized protein (DUF362 family)
MTTRREFLAGLGAAAAGAVAARPRTAAAFRPAAPVKARVVVVRDDALAADSPAPEKVRALLDAAAQALEGVGKAGDAWAASFKPGDRVGIKVNCLGLPTRPAVALGLAEALAAAEVAPDRVLIWDRFNRELRAAGHDLRTSGRGVRCYGTDALGARGSGGYAPDVATSGQIGSLYSRIVTDETTALVSAAVLKDHNLAGLTGVLKNFYGAIHNPNKYHMNGCDPFIADVCAHANVRGRLRLAVCDAGRPQYNGGPPARPPWQWPYGGLILSRDPVAADRVAAEILDRKRRAAGLKSLQEDGRPVRYLASAEARGLGTADLARIEVIGIGKPWLDVG